MSQYAIHICFGGPVYRYNGVTFEWHHYCGPIPLRADMEPRAHPSLKHWQAIDDWCRLPKEEQERYRIHD